MMRFRVARALSLFSIVGLLLGGGLLLSPSTARADASGLPLPRFVSLRADKVNLRAGPGEQYPIDWTYVRRYLPVEVIAEFDVWRKIRDPSGTEGWVLGTMLSGRRMVVVEQDRTMLRHTADETAEPVAWLDKGVVAKLVECPNDVPYCRIEVDGYQGWVERSEIWGVYTNEAVK